MKKPQLRVVEGDRADCLQIITINDGRTPTRVSLWANKQRTIDVKLIATLLSIDLPV